MTWDTNDSNSLEKIYVLPCTAKWWKPRASEYAAIPPLKVNQYVRAPKLHTDRFLTTVHMTFFLTRNKQIHFSLWQKIFFEEQKNYCKPEIFKNSKVSSLEGCLKSNHWLYFPHEFPFVTTKESIVGLLNVFLWNSYPITRGLMGWQKGIQNARGWKATWMQISVERPNTPSLAGDVITYLEMGMARTVKWTQLFPFVVVNLVLVIAFRLILLVGNSFATKGKGTFLFFSTARYTYC